MSTPLWLGSGGCPVIEILGAFYVLTPALAGWSEFEQSTPPNYYRQFTVSGPGWTWTSHVDGSPDQTQVGVAGGLCALQWASTSDSQPAIDGSTTDAHYNYTNFGHVLGNNGTTDVFVAGGDTTSGTLLLLSGNRGAASAAGVSALEDYLAKSPFNMSVGATSATTLRVSMAATSSFGDSVTSGYIDYTLSVPDTADDAISRALTAYGDADPTIVGPVDLDVGDIFAAGIFTTYESRSTTAIEKFGYQKGSIQLQCTKMMPGRLYHPVIVLEERDAVGDGSGDTSGYGSTWTTYGTLTIADFRPTDTTFTTDAVDLPVVAGKQIRIKSISVTPIDG